MKKLMSWNVNGIRSAATKGFVEYIEKLDPEVFCLQEIKAEKHQIPFELKNYHYYINSAKKKGYSGTAIYSKEKPLNVTYGINIQEHDQEGRVITLEFDTYFIVTVYTPNSKSELIRLPYRVQWEKDFLSYIKSLDEKKPVLLCGDLNVAHKEIDLTNPKSNRMNPGFSDEERERFTILLENGFVDTFRHFYPNKTHSYSWWSYRFNSRDKNIGWRIDYWVVSERFMDKVVDSCIDSDILGSDHCPVVLYIN